MASSSRESTWPDASWLLAVADTVIREWCSSAVPDLLRPARSAWSEAWYAAAPCGATTRTVIAPGPEPKEARTAGAQPVARLLPNSARTAAVWTTTSEGTGSGDAGPSMTSLPAGKPCALSAAHITASHDTVASGLTCSATQAAACAGIAARAVGGREKCLTAAAASDPVMMTARPSTTRRAPARRRGLPGRDRTAGTGSAAVRAPAAGSGLAAGRDLAAEPGHPASSSPGTGPVTRSGPEGTAAAAPVRSPLVRLPGELVSGHRAADAADHDSGGTIVMPGDNATVAVNLDKPVALDIGSHFAIREGGKTVGSGVITEVVE